MNPKCSECGLVNFPDASECKRCGAGLAREGEPLGGEAAVGDSEEGEVRPPRSLTKKLTAGFAAAAVALVVWYFSLLATSTAVNYEERRAVERAVAVIERAGLTKDARLLRRLASFRTTDNWWNASVGHADAFAATNFPFEIVTLYPQFFTDAKDDTERAVILLHEARHLAGSDEHEAFSSVWRDKARLGYTADKYLGTQVWSNVTEYTMKYAPELFRCGADGQTDCVGVMQAAGR